MVTNGHVLRYKHNLTAQLQDHVVLWHVETKILNQF
jgi:hypothetical protein